MVKDAQADTQLPGAHAGRAFEVIGPEASAADPATDERWDAFVAASPYGHLMQTSRWGALKSDFGWDVERVAVTEGGTIVGGAQILYRPLPLGRRSLAYVPMGPVVDWDDAVLVDSVLRGVRDSAQRRGAFCLKAEPTALNGSEGVARLASTGFRSSPQTVQWRSTIVVDLARSEDEILAGFDKEHRRKVRKAAREGIVIRPGTSADVPEFCRLLDQTAERKTFAAYPCDYYKATYNLLGSHGLGQLLLATYEDTVLAGVMVFTQGTAAYMTFAASCGLHRELYPTYLMQWEGMRWARAQGCTTYDFCGIPDEVGADPARYAHDGRTEGMWGVYRFKRGFTGRVVGYAGTQDQVYSNWLYHLYSGAIGVLEGGLGETWNRKLFSG